MTTTDASTPDTWDAQLEKLRARYKHVRPPILVALNILMHDQNIALDDAKAQAAGHGVKITAASVAAAHRLLSRQDGMPAAPAIKAATPPQGPARRAQPTGIPFDAEALVRGVVAKIQGQGSVEADRLREAMRKAIGILTAAVE